MPFQLHDRRAVVSGGASGIGAAVAEALALAGASVLSTDRDEASSMPGQAQFHRADLRRQEDVDSLFSASQQHLGRPNVLVSCAGIGIHERLDEGDPAKWGEVIETNVMGTLRLIRAFVPAMLDEGGDVILVSSVAAHQAYPWGGVYSASKSAIEMIGETLRLESLPKLRVLTLAPGVVDTAFFDHMISGNQTAESIGFGSVSPDQIAELVLFALSRPSNMALNHLVVRPRGQPF